MPDLDIVTMSMCNSNVDWQRKVVGSDGKTVYTVRFERVDPNQRQVEYDFTCNCKGYHYRGEQPGFYCRHIKAVRHEHCGWDQLTHGGEPARTPGSGTLCCPRCGRDVEHYRAGV